MTKDERLWNDIADHPILHQQWGYVFATMSVARYGHCRLRHEGDPSTIFRENSFTILKDGEEMKKHYWSGGLILAFKLIKSDGRVQVWVGELSYEAFQRNGREKSLNMEKVLKENLLVYRFVWEGELP